MDTDKINCTISYCFTRAQMETENPDKALSWLKLAQEWSKINHMVAEWKAHNEEG